MDEESKNETMVPQSNFQQLYQKRINEIEQKVSKYCSQYDALMNLLPIGNQFSILPNFQKDMEALDTKIDSLNIKINDINNDQLPIDRNFWQKQITKLNSLHAENQIEITKIQQNQNEKTKKVQDLEFQQKLAQKLKIYEKQITTKLANYKNKVEKSRYNESKSGYKRVYQSINEKIQSHLKSYHRQLDELLEEIQICRLKVPVRDLKDFHDFNHNRLLQEILNLNQILEGLFETLNHPNESNDKIDISQIEEINTQIESIRYQAIGNRQKCLKDMLIYHNYGATKNQMSWEKMENHINDCFYQLEESLKEIRERTNLLLRFFTQN